MELSKKVKVALDETRMLILGTQILLGFQFRGVFGDGYDQLPADSRYLSGATLGLTICVVNNHPTRCVLALTQLEKIEAWQAFGSR